MKPNVENSSGIYLFKLFGFKVSIDWSWFFLAILIIWTLAVGYFPIIIKDLTQAQYWAMGLFGAVGLFISIILHELCHSLVGRRYDMPIKGIKLFIFGGIAEMREEPVSPKAEFLMSAAGPAASIFLGFIFNLIYELGMSFAWPHTINGIFMYLSFINYLLAIFNLLPGFPLDGGRVLRSFLWWWKDDLVWATEIAAKIGIAFGFGLILFGILNIILLGNFIGGIWFSLIGLFLQYIARTSLQNTLIKSTFQTQIVKDFMKKELITVKPDMTVVELIDNYFYKYYHKLYPVVEDEKLIGYVTLNNIGDVPNEKRHSLKIRDIMQENIQEISLDIKTKVNDALQKMNEQRQSRFLVIENNKLYGIITLKDLMDVIIIKTRLQP